VHRMKHVVTVLIERDGVISSQTREFGGLEFEHRLNGLRAIASLLSLQSRAAKSPEVAAELNLNIAAVPMVSFGRVHRRYTSSIIRKLWS
jgi:hypothetical protein